MFASKKTWCLFVIFTVLTASEFERMDFICYGEMSLKFPRAT